MSEVIHVDFRKALIQYHINVYLKSYIITEFKETSIIGYTVGSKREPKEWSSKVTVHLMFMLILVCHKEQFWPTNVSIIHEITANISSGIRLFADEQNYPIRRRPSLSTIRPKLYNGQNNGNWTLTLTNVLYLHVQDPSVHLNIATTLVIQYLIAQTNTHILESYSIIRCHSLPILTT